MKVPSYSASDGVCLVLWLRLAGRLVAVDGLVGRFVTVGFRVVAVLCAGALLGVVGVGAGSVVVAISSSCTAAASGPSVTSLVTTMTSDTVTSSTIERVSSVSVEDEVPFSEGSSWYSSSAFCGGAIIWCNHFRLRAWGGPFCHMRFKGLYMGALRLHQGLCFRLLFLSPLEILVRFLDRQHQFRFLPGLLLSSLQCLLG